MTTLPPRHKTKRGKDLSPECSNGAGKEARTPDLNLGKVALYQLSYSRTQSGNYKKCLRAGQGKRVGLSFIHQMRQSEFQIKDHR